MCSKKAEQTDFASAEPPRRKVNCDHEAWLQDRILTAMRMGIELQKQARVGADKDAFEYGMKGVAEGTAREVIYMLGLEPEYVNIRDFSPGGCVNLQSLTPGDD